MRWEERLIDVTVVGTTTRRVAGLRVHRARSLDPRDVWRRDGIRVTSPARTLLDLAAVLPPEALRRAARQAQAERRVNVRQLREIVARSNGHRGVAALRAIVADGPAPTRSDLEDALLDLLDGAGIARPEVNAPLRLDGRTDRARLPLARPPDRDRGRQPPLARRPAHARATTPTSRRSSRPHGYRVLRIDRPADRSTGPQQTLARIRAALGLVATTTTSASALRMIALPSCVQIVSIVATPSSTSRHACR